MTIPATVTKTNFTTIVVFKNGEGVRRRNKSNYALPNISNNSHHRAQSSDSITSVVLLCVCTLMVGTCSTGACGYPEDWMGDFCSYRGISCSIERLREDNLWFKLRAPYPRLRDDISGATLRAPPEDGTTDTTADVSPEFSLRHPYLFGRTFEQLYGVSLPTTDDAFNETILQSTLASINFAPVVSSSLFVQFDSSSSAVPNATASNTTGRSIGWRVPLNPFHSYTLFKDGSSGIAYAAKQQHPPLLTPEDYQKALSGQQVDIKLCSGGRALSSALGELQSYLDASPTNRSEFPPALFLRQLDPTQIDTSRGDIETGGATINYCSLMFASEPRWANPIIHATPFLSAEESHNETDGDYVCPLLPHAFLTSSPSVGVPPGPLSHLKLQDDPTLLEAPCACLPPSLQDFIFNASQGALTNLYSAPSASSVSLGASYVSTPSLERLLNESVVVGRVVRVPAAPNWDRKSFSVNGTVQYESTVSIKTTNSIFAYGYAYLNSGGKGYDTYKSPPSIRTNLPSAPISDFNLKQPYSPDMLELFLMVDAFTSFRLRGTPEVNNVSAPTELYPGFNWVNYSRELPPVEWNIFQREGYVAYLNISFVIQEFINPLCNFTAGFQPFPVSRESPGFEEHETIYYPNGTHFFQIVEVQLIAPDRAAANQDPVQPPDPVVDTGTTEAEETAVESTGGTVQVIGVIAGVPSVALQMGVLDALRGLTQCNVNSDISQLPDTGDSSTSTGEESDEEEDTEDESEGTMSRLESPLQMGFGSKRGYYLRGALVGNLLVGFIIFPACLIFIIVCFILPLAKFLGIPNINLRSTLVYLFGFPSVFLLIFGVVLEGTSFAAVGLLLMSRPADQEEVKSWAAFDIIFSLMCLVVLITFTAHMWYMMAFRHIIQRLRNRPPGLVPSATADKNRRGGTAAAADPNAPMQRQNTLDRVLGSFSSDSDSVALSLAISDAQALSWNGSAAGAGKGPDHVSKKGFPGVLLPIEVAHVRSKQIEALERDAKGSRQNSDDVLGSIGGRQNTFEFDVMSRQTTESAATGSFSNVELSMYAANQSFARPRSRAGQLFLKLITSKEVWVPRCLARPITATVPSYTPAQTPGGGVGGMAGAPGERQNSDDFYEGREGGEDAGEVAAGGRIPSDIIQLSLSTASSGAKTPPPLVLAYRAESEWLSRYAQYYDDSRLTWYTPLEITVALLVGMLAGVPTSIMESGSDSQSAFCVIRAVIVFIAMLIQLTVSIAYKVGLLKSFHVLTIAGNTLNAFLGFIVVVHVCIGVKVEAILAENRRIYAEMLRAILAANPEVVITSFDQIENPDTTTDPEPWLRAQRGLMQAIVAITLIAAILGTIRVLLEVCRFVFEHMHQLVQLWRKLVELFTPKKAAPKPEAEEGEPGFVPGTHRNFGHKGDEDILNAAANRATDDDPNAPPQKKQEPDGSNAPQNEFEFTPPSSDLKPPLAPVPPALEPINLSDSSEDDKPDPDAPLILRGERGQLPSTDSNTDDESGTWSAIFSKETPTKKKSKLKKRSALAPVEEDDGDTDWQMLRHKKSSSKIDPTLTADGYFAPEAERESVTFSTSTATSVGTSGSTFSTASRASGNSLSSNISRTSRNKSGRVARISSMNSEISPITTRPSLPTKKVDQKKADDSDFLDL